MHEEIYLCLSIAKIKCLLNKKKGWGTLYAACPCIENTDKFYISVRKSSDWCSLDDFWSRNTMYVIKN